MPDRQLLEVRQGAALWPHLTPAQCPGQALAQSRVRLGAGDVFVSSFYLLAPFSLPLPVAPGKRAQERQGQPFGPGVQECGLFLATPRHQAALLVWAEPVGSWHLLAVPVRSLLCLPVSNEIGLSPGSSRL